MGGCCLNNCRIGFLVCLSLMLAACNSGSSDLAGQSDDINELVRLSEQNNETLVVTTQQSESDEISIILDGVSESISQSQIEILAPDTPRPGQIVISNNIAKILEKENGTEIETYKSEGRQSQYSDISQAELDELILVNTTLAFNFVSVNDENIVKFPYGQTLAYSLLAVGAANNTLNSIFQKLNDPDIKLDRYHAVVNVWKSLVGSSLEDTMNQSLGFWGQINYPFRMSYLDQLAINYGPEMTGLNFSNYPDESSLEIKSWLVKKNPDLPIDQVGWSISNRTRIVSVNAEMIQTEWSSNGLTVSRLDDGRFETIEETMFSVPMIHFEGVLNSFATEQYRAVQLPTQNSNFVLVVVMPHRGEFAAVKNQLGPEFLARLANSFEPTAMEFYLPEFELSTMLSDLSPYKAGLAYIADFSAVNSLGFLYAESFMQKGSLTVSIAGLNSQSTTSFQLDATDDEPESFNSAGVFARWEAVSFPCYDPVLTKAQPFMYALLEKQTNTILVSGQYVIPGHNDSAVKVEPDWLGSGMYGCDEPSPISLEDKFSLAPGSSSAPVEWDVPVPPEVWGPYTNGGGDGPF